jgi:circadian clock protein KaiC
MNDPTKALRLLKTGVPGLDEVLGGGLPENSFNLIAGPPGAGKTTLTHQLIFANATAERPALYFTVLGEPALKMLRYQQQMAFFEPAKVGEVIKFVDLSDVVTEGDLGRVLDSIVTHVRELNPGIVVVDSFRTVARGNLALASGEAELQSFLQRLALYLASWQATSFLVGEYAPNELQDNPVFTIADGIIWLTQENERNSTVRKIQALKVRGLGSIPGLHSFRISEGGVRVFPRTHRTTREGKRSSRNQRASTGMAEMDAILGGGLPTGDATLVAGPSGTGKSVFTSAFIAEGARRGEPSVMAIFEEHPDDYLARADEMGFGLTALLKAGKLKVINLMPMDLSTDEILHQMQDAVEASNATRLVIDSINGLELTLSPTQRDDFRESFYRLVGQLTGRGVSVVMTVEVGERFDEIKFSPHEVSFMAQNIIHLRYAEIDGRLRKVLAVVKMRRSAHSPALHDYDITSSGMKLRGMLDAYQGILTGVPSLRSTEDKNVTPGLNPAERRVFEALPGLTDATEAAVVRATGLPAEEVASALERLVALYYVVRIEEGSGTVFRQAFRTLGST